MNTTMEDIARECGVTKMTVSRVLAGKDNVKPATRERILEAATRLKYEINTLAQNLNMNRSGFVAVATPFEGLLGSPYFSEVVLGFDQVFKDADLDLALFNTHSESFNDGAKLAKLYRQRRVDGLLVVAAHTDDQFIATLEQRQLPMVVVGEQVASTNVCSVSCHDARGIDLVCSHLYALGHRKIAFIEGPRDFLTAIRRKQAYLDFCQQQGLEVPASYIQPGAFTMNSGRMAGSALLDLADRPTAIVAANDMMAFGVMEAARARKLDIPGDVSVTGFDDLAAAAERYPSLTTIHQPVREMGVLGAQLLLKAMARDPASMQQTTLDVSLVIRESTRPPRPTFATPDAGCPA